MSVANICIIIAIVVYLAAMVIVGIVCSKKNNSVDDFYLGGKHQHMRVILKSFAEEIGNCNGAYSA